MRLKYTLLLGAILFSFNVHAQNVVDRYIDKYKSLATDLSKEYGIPVSVILGVAVVESSAGRGRTAEVLHNHFGIVGKNHLSHKGSKTHSRYKQYKTPEASYRAFCGMISRKKFYDKMKGSSDYKKWIYHMKHANYSEIPEIWEKKVLQIIKKYDLTSFDLKDIN